MSDRHADARKVLRWIKANRKTEVAREEVRVEALAKRLDAEGVQTIINSLVPAGWLRERDGAQAEGRDARTAVGRQPAALHSPWGLPERSGKSAKNIEPPNLPVFPEFPEGVQGLKLRARERDG